MRHLIAKATGRFDDVDLLGVVGRTQIGRLRYSALNAELNEEVPFQSIDEILRARRGGELFDYLLDRFAAHSGLSGVQPKVLIRAETDGPEGKTSGRKSSSFRSATHIVKLWEAAEYPELAANEFFCLTAARRAGVPTLRRRGGARSRPVRSQRRRLSGVRGFLRAERGTYRRQIQW